MGSSRPVPESLAMVVQLEYTEESKFAIIVVKKDTWNNAAMRLSDIQNGGILKKL